MLINLTVFHYFGILIGNVGLIVFYTDNSLLKFTRRITLAAMAGC
jgi:hypothetical protein